jgi:hypothetical protein
MNENLTVCPYDMLPLKPFRAVLESAQRTLLPTCRDVHRLQSLAWDHSIAWPKRLGLGLHLLVCKWCRRYGKQICVLRDAVRDHPEHFHETAPHVLTTASRERLKQRLRTHPK